MNDTHTAAIMDEAFGEEGGDMMAGFVAVHAVQVEMSLYHPAAAAQIPEYARGHAGLEPGGLIAPFECQIKGISLRKGFIQCGALIFQVLTWNGGRRGWFMMDPIQCERHCVGDSIAKQGARCLIERPGRHDRYRRLSRYFSASSAA
jgi:hypothetical protein